MKKVLSVLVALVLVLSISTMASAAKATATATDDLASFFEDIAVDISYALESGDINDLADQLFDALDAIGIDSILDIDTSKAADAADAIIEVCEKFGIPKDDVYAWLVDKIPDTFASLYVADIDKPEVVKTGSTTGIAVFAALSVAAAAAFVATKAKKD